MECEQQRTSAYGVYAGAWYYAHDSRDGLPHVAFVDLERRHFHHAFRIGGLVTLYVLLGRALHPAREPRTLYHCEMTQKGSSESWLMAMLTAVDSSSSSLYLSM